MAPITPPTSAQTEEKVTTVIAEDLHIKGSLRFETSLMIKGSLEGEIISGGLLVVGSTAKINATIVTGRLISHGEIQGEVTASEQVVLKGTAVQTGAITAPYVIMESGSIFNGSFMMKRDAVAESPQNETGEEGKASPG
jgi:cytoskeletal protein CcmA (bactofilin family)